MNFARNKRIQATGETFPSGWNSQHILYKIVSNVLFWREHFIHLAVSFVSLGVDTVCVIDSPERTNIAVQWWNEWISHLASFIARMSSRVTQSDSFLLLLLHVSFEKGNENYSNRNQLIYYITLAAVTRSRLAACTCTPLIYSFGCVKSNGNTYQTIGYMHFERVRQVPSRRINFSYILTKRSFNWLNRS